MQDILAWPWRPCFVFPLSWKPEPAERHFVYADLGPTSDPAVYLHTATKNETEDPLAHMRFLYRIGFEKAVIMRQIAHCRGLTEIQFLVSVGQMESDARPPKPTSEWPSQQPRLATGPMYEVPILGSTPACLLKLGVSGDQLLEFFEHSQRYALCHITEGLDFPEVVTTHIQQLTPVDHIDRIIIFSHLTRADTTWRLSVLRSNMFLMHGLS